MMFRRHMAGFTLVELAVAVFVITLLLGSILVPLATQVEQRQISETQKAMDEIRDALMGFAASNGYLPCPAVSSTNGAEDRPTGTTTCTGGKRQGYLPWEALGVAKLDAWGHLYRYSVTPAYANSSVGAIALNTGADMRVRTRNAAGALANLTNANIVVATVISHGKNGYGAVDNDGTAVSLPAGWPTGHTDENTNLTGSTTFISRAPQAAGTATVGAGAGGEFDDQVAWISQYSLANRLVSAGKLP